MDKLSERLEHWEDLSPMEFVAIRKEVAQLEEEKEALLEVIRRAELDVRVNLNPMLERMNTHPFTLLEKDLRKALKARGE